MSIGPFKASSNSEQIHTYKWEHHALQRPKKKRRRKLPYDKKERAYLLEQMKNNDLYKVKFSHLLD